MLDFFFRVFLKDLESLSLSLFIFLAKLFCDVFRLLTVTVMGLLCMRFECWLGTRDLD